MALIACSECGKEISEKAPACPNCGAPQEASKPSHSIDPAKAVKFRNSKTAQVVSIENAAVFTLFFGCLYFALRGVWTHAAVSLVLAIVTWGISWLIYPFFAKSIMRNRLIESGWIAVA